MRKDGADTQKVKEAKNDEPGNPTVNFHGEKRSNQTHQSTTDGQSVLYKRATGKEAKLCCGGHILMENRNGLCADFTIHNPIAQGEPAMALQPLDEHVRLHEGTRPRTVGADKGCHQSVFVAGCRERAISPHVSCKERTRVKGLDKRTTERAGYRTSLRIRKRVEEIFGWIKTVGGLRRTRYLGIEKTQAAAYFVAGTYNLLRMARLELAAAS